MPENFDELLSAGAARLEQEAAVRSPAGVRARGDQRRRRHTATMAVVPVAVLAIAGTVGLTLRPSGGSSGHTAGPPPSASSGRTSGGSTAPDTTPGSTAASALTGTVDLGRHTLTVRDAQGKVVKTLAMTAGAPAHPTQTGTFTVADKKPSKTISSSAAPSGVDTYDITVASFIGLGPNGPAIYAAPWAHADFGKDNVSHGDIELAADDAAWLYHQLTVGDTIQIAGSSAG